MFRNSSSSIFPLLLLVVVFLLASSLDALNFRADAAAHQPDAAAAFRIPTPQGHVRSKRQALSVTQDLMSLADMIHDEAVRRRVKNARLQLAALGRKRSDPFYAPHHHAGYVIDHVLPDAGQYDVAPSYDDDWDESE